MSFLLDLIVFGCAWLAISSVATILWVAAMRAFGWRDEEPK